MTETFALLCQSSHIFHLQRIISKLPDSSVSYCEIHSELCSAAREFCRLFTADTFCLFHLKKIRAEVKEHTRSLSCTTAVTRCYAVQRRIIINLLKIMAIHIQTLDLIHLLYCVYKCLICSSVPSTFTYCCFSCFSH